MKSKELEELFFELLDRWYCTENAINQEFETFNTNYTEETDKDYFEYKQRFENIKKELITIGLE
ncbi:hypothetical protein [Aerococcus viridans]|uniref:Uncharacterized protein n=1 Tax=Aerococcus viridans TaxID=1377 RepID=A0A2J9PKG5_9LACT|nr:hypothetical protein [Aerococcus viridans]PNL90832.1 hypothetical protein A6J77_000540 [Aerococcus viridans]